LKTGGGKNGSCWRRWGRKHELFLGRGKLEGVWGEVQGEKGKPCGFEQKAGGSGTGRTGGLGTQQSSVKYWTQPKGGKNHERG